LSLDILGHVIPHVKANPLKISLQLDEITEISNWSKLIALVRYVHDGAMKENFLSVKNWKQPQNSKF